MKKAQTVETQTATVAPQISEENFAILAQETTPNVVDAVALLREAVEKREQRLAIERWEAEHKSAIDAIRDGQDRFLIEGEYLGRNGKFQVKHVESLQTYASAKILLALVEAKKIRISKKNLATVINEVEKEYNLVSWKVKAK